MSPKISENFRESECRCNCGCGTMIINKCHLALLEEMRVLAGIPITPSSWTRCEKHNADVGGTDTSSHLRGIATDIVAISSLGRYTLLSAALRAGFRRIGIGKNFIHVDCDSTKPRNVVWVY